MKVLQVTSPTEYELIDLPTPEPGENQVLLKVDAVTTCPQWDLHLRHNEPMFVGHSFHYPYTPGQPGHEAVGTVAAIGAGVSGIRVGDYVAAWKDQGHRRQGCYAQYVIVDAAHVVPVPKELPPEELAPVELAMCVGSVFLMLRSMDVLAGRRVAISGLGPAGLIAAQMAQAEGAGEVIGFDLNPGRRSFACERGIVHRALDPREVQDDEFPTRPKVPTINTAIDCVGGAKSVHFLMDHTEDVVALFGVQREPYTFDVRHHRGLRLCGYKGHSRDAAEYAVSLVRAGALRLGHLVTHHFPLEKYGEAVDLLEKQQAIKVCFWPWKEG